MKRQDPRHILYRVDFYHQFIELEIDRERCIHCELCSLACPNQAIWIAADEKGLEIHLDERLCVLCEVCAYICPVSAIRLSFNETSKAILRESDALPPMTEKLKVDRDKCPHRCESVAEGVEHWCRKQQALVENRQESCPKSCFRCVERCPRNVYEITPEGTHPDLLSCLRCMQCLQTCDYGAITVSPLFLAEVRIRAELCPDDCSLCIEACPVDVIQRVEGKVTLVQDTCAFCGACVNACDRDAVRLLRHRVELDEVASSPLWDRLKRALLTLPDHPGNHWVSSKEEKDDMQT